MAAGGEISDVSACKNFIFVAWFLQGMSPSVWRSRWPSRSFVSKSQTGHPWSACTFFSCPDQIFISKVSKSLSWQLFSRRLLFWRILKMRWARQLRKLKRISLQNSDLQNLSEKKAVKGTDVRDLLECWQKLERRELSWNYFAAAFTLRWQVSPDFLCGLWGPVLTCD